jgi:hypothetical protein
MNMRMRKCCGSNLRFLKSGDAVGGKYVELGVWSWEFGVGSLELGVWSWELGVWSWELGVGSLGSYLTAVRRTPSERTQRTERCYKELGAVPMLFFDSLKGIKKERPSFLTTAP